jgi:hypothetical protein
MLLMWIRLIGVGFAGDRFLLRRNRGALEASLIPRFASG